MVVKPENWPFSYLPELRRGLRLLDARDLQLETLPPLPSTLIVLFLSGNKKLKSLPPLPNSLEELLIDDTGITELPPLPSNLERLEVQGSQITSLPELPQKLRTLMCYNTSITELPSLPASLKTLGCGSTLIAELPQLPPYLWLLGCGSCRLRTLPRLPDGVSLRCLPNPWNPAFAAIFQPLGYQGATTEYNAAVNRYHDIQEIKAKARDVANIHATLARAWPEDVANVIGSYVSGQNTTLANQLRQLACLQKNLVQL
jgi:Leucine-rich repeat (LRR) protein